MYRANGPMDTRRPSHQTPLAIAMTEAVYVPNHDFVFALFLCVQMTIRNASAQIVGWFKDGGAANTGLRANSLRQMCRRTQKRCGTR
jgi:hypothetical protein